MTNWTSAMFTSASRSTLWLALPAILMAAPQAPSAGGQRDSPARDAPGTTVGTALVGGVVMSDETDSRPVRRAVVSLKGDIVVSRAAITDDNGRFAIPALPAGRFTLTVARAGWVTTLYGAKRPWRPPGVAIALAAGQHVTGISVRMMRGAVITGRITDEENRPLVSVRPALFELRTISGQRRLVAVTVAQGTPAGASDDRGEYRFFGLPPGDYLVGATPECCPPGFRQTTADDVRSARSGLPVPRPGGGPPPNAGPIQSYATTYYPGTFDPNAASPLTVAAGQERVGVDFVVRAVATSRVQGTVTRGDGLPPEGARVNIVPLSDGGLSTPLGPIPVSNVGPDGRFSFAAVRPGRYAVGTRASSSQAAGSTGRAAGSGQAPVMDLWAQAEISVAGQDLDGVALVLESAARIRGRVAFVGANTAAAPALSTARIQIVAQPGTIAASPLDRARLIAGFLPPDGTFSFDGIPPGRYRVGASLTSLADRWVLRSITIGNRDVTDTGLDIRSGMDLSDVVVTFTDRVSELSGMLVDDLGRPAPEYYVFAFPVDRSAWTESSPRMRAPVRPASDGRFRIGPLFPGAYHVVALTGFEEFDYLDPTFLEQLIPGAVDLTLGEGEKKVQDLKLRTAP